MITTHKVPYREGELRIGWASWDDGNYEERSIKFAYPDSSGKISRGSPELPFEVLVDMLRLAADQGELDKVVPQSLATRVGEFSQLSLEQLREERETLSGALRQLQGLLHEIPWANWKPVYNEIGLCLDFVKAEISQRKERGY